MNSLLLKFFFLSISITAFFSCEKNAPQNTSPSIIIKDKVALDSILDQYVKDGFYPFIYARLENMDGELIYGHSAVNKKLNPNLNIDGSTWFRIWSMSKIITISVALDLIEEGVLKFDDPVSKYIPEFKDLKVAVSANGKNLTDLEWGNRENACPIKLIPNDSVMTVLHLINHQSGFYYAATGYECLDSMLAKKNIATSKNTKEFIDRLAEMPLVMHPGTNHFYGTNTTVLGFVAERATGKNLKELVAERITKPLNIKGLQYGLPEGVELLGSYSGKDSILRKAHKGELDIFGPDVPDYDPAHELYLGGEGMLGTADGYADFVRMLLTRGELNGHRFLNKETVEDIYAPHTQLDNKYGHNGYNLWISGDSMRVKGQGDAGLWIGGGYEGTHFWADDKRGFVGVIMSQANFVRSPGYEMNDKFRGELYRQIFEGEKENN